MKRILIALLLCVVFATPSYGQVKTSALPEVTSVVAADILPVVASGVTSKIQMSNLGVPGTVGGAGTVLRGGGAGVIPGWSTFTIADTFAKGSFVYVATANTLDAFTHPGAANCLIATNSADGVGYFSSSAAVITILGSADAETFRSNAGLAIGTNVQAASNILLGIAATTPAAGLLGYTGAAYDWFTGISLSNSSLRHFYDDTAGYYSVSDCIADDDPVVCCDGPGAGTCAPKYVGFNPIGMTGTKAAVFLFRNTADANFTMPVQTGYVQATAADGATTDLLVGGGAATLPVWTAATGTGAPVRANTPTLITPVIGAATGTSLIVTGRLDGLAGLLITTAASPTTISIATHGSSSYFMNIGNSAANSIFTLPTAASGLQYCIKNYTGISAVMKFQTSAAGQYIDLDGTLTATGGLIKSAGAAGDAACVVGVDATHWVAYVQKGVWSRD